MSDARVIVKYPCWRYHATEAPRLCLTPDEETALGREWVDSPAYVKLNGTPVVGPLPKPALVIADTQPITSDPVYAPHMPTPGRQRNGPYKRRATGV